MLLPKLHTLKDLFWQTSWRVGFFKLNSLQHTEKNIKIQCIIQDFSRSGCSSLITYPNPHKPFILAILKFLKCLEFLSSCLFTCFYLKCSFSTSSLKAYIRYHFLWKLSLIPQTFASPLLLNGIFFIILWAPWWPVSRIFREAIRNLVAGAMTYSLCLRQSAQDLTYTESWYIFILQMNE